jgi:uncharacterized protein YndB with AHSA1/START domain
MLLAIISIGVIEMDEINSRLGTLQRRGEQIDVKFERFYRRPIESVWKSLTEPERLADWMGRSYVEPFVGGRYETLLDGLKPMRGTVRIWQPPSLLEYEWHSDHAPQSIARWELSVAVEGTRLVFTHLGMPYANANLMMPGWHVYLDHLGAALSTTSPRDFLSAWRELQDEYARHHGLEALTREP